MQTLSQTFAGASTWQLNIGGRYFTTLGCTNPVNVRFYHGGKKLDLGEITGLLAGLEVTFPGEGFDRVEIDATGIDTIQVGIGNGQARYNRSQGNVAITNTGGAFTQGQASVTNADQAIIAANANRRFLQVQNNDASAVLRVMLDGTAASATKGFRVQPGQTLDIPNFCPTGAIHAFMETATAAANNVEFVTG